MRKVLVFSILLVAGLALSQVLPSLLGDGYASAAPWIRVLTMAALAFIMIHVGFEFDIDKSNLKQYGWDYVVAFTAATFPWIFVTAYFVFVMLPADVWSDFDSWKETLLAGRFAAPTSAGVLFAMLAAAGLSTTWLFRKARVLAIFDDLDTVLLMIPLKMLMVGLAWQLGIVVLLMVAMLAAAYIWLHEVRLPVTWKWVAGYAAVIAIVSEMIYAGTKWIDDSVPIHIEVLLPAFVLGCLLARPDGRHDVLEAPDEQRAATWVAAVFMVLVGLNMPAMIGGAAPTPEQAATITAAQPHPGWGVIALHVLAVTVISNVGKMFPAFCYRREAHWRERLAVAIGMWPRGEVGAGVLVVSLSYAIGGPIVTVAMLSLALNLVLTGVFIMIVKRLVADLPATSQPSTENTSTQRPSRPAPSDQPLVKGGV